MAFRWWFNGHDMSKYLETNDVQRNIGQSRKATLQKVGQAPGKKFQYTTADESKIVVSFLVRHDLVTKRRDIAGLLATSEPAQLIFGDEIDKYYMAIADDQTTLTEKFRHGNGEITFIVPDGLAHAVFDQTLTNQAKDGSLKNTINLHNIGTEPTPVKVTAEFAKENGFLGLSLAGHYYQIGNAQEANGVTYDDSQNLVPAAPSVDKYAMNDTGFVIPNAGQVGGSIQQWDDGPAGSHFAPPADGFGASNGHTHGPMMVYSIPKDSEGNAGVTNFTFRMQAGVGNSEAYSTANANETGEIFATIFDGNKNPMATVEMGDWSPDRHEFHMLVTVNGQEVYRHEELDSPGWTGWSYLIKSGSVFTFGWLGAQGTTSFTSVELADAKAAYVGFAFTKWADCPAPRDYGLINWTFRKDNANVYKDIRNYFQAGDKLVLDSATNMLTVNDFPDWDRVDIGSRPLLAPPGDSTLGIVASDWGGIPKVTVNYRERWL